MESEKSLDSLYPLRAEIKKETDKSNLQLAKTDEVFVFGSNRNESRGFGFKIGNLVRNICNIFKWK